MKPGRKYLISKTLLKSSVAQPGSKPFELDDSRLPGFKLRIQPSGVRSYVIQWARGKRKTLARVGELTPSQAREKAEIVLANVRTGKPALRGLDSRAVPTLGEFIDGGYADRIQDAHKRPQQTLKRLKYCFAAFYGNPLTDDITADLEAWKSSRLNAGASPSSVRRDLATLSGVYRRASRLKRKELGLLANPVADVERPAIDTDVEPKSLSRDGEKVLRTALLERDTAAIQARERNNVNRQKLSKIPRRELLYFADHLTPMVLLSINTGCRRGEMFALTWDRVDHKKRTISFSGSTTKNQRTRTVPLNDEAMLTLRQWQEQSARKNGLVFPGPHGSEFTTIKTAWLALLRKAKVKITWHGLRHTFGTRLADAGVGLHTICALMGHSDIRITARYTRARDPAKRAAVDLLGNASGSSDG